MALFTLDLRDWPVDFLLARVHKVTNLTVGGGGGVSSHFVSSPGSFAASFGTGLWIEDGEYAPFGGPVGAINFTGSLPETEQYVFNNSEVHVGYAFHLLAAPVVGTFGATWSPPTRQLSWAFTSQAVTAPPVITTLGSGASGSGVISFDIGDLSTFNTSLDRLFVFWVYAGSRGVLTPTVSIEGFRAYPFDMEGTPPPVGNGRGPIAFFRSSGLATSIQDPGIVGGSWFFTRLLPPTATLRHRFRAASN